MFENVYIFPKRAPACYWPHQATINTMPQQQVIYCFNYRQKEYQKDFITTLIGMTPAGPLQGQRGSPSLFTKLV